MSQIIVEKFSGLGLSDIPRLFSRTCEFRFHSWQGQLVHRKLPCGPKGYAVVAVTSTGHEASFAERHRVALTIPVTGRSEVCVGGRTVVTEPGEIFAIGPSERRSNLIPHGGAGYYRSYTIICPFRSADILSDGIWLHRPDDHAYQQLRQFIEFAFDAFSDAQEIAATKLALIEALIEDLFFDALREPGDDSADEPGHRHDSLVRTAQVYMEAHLGEPLSTSDIAGALGVGTRTLQIAFQHLCGMAPKQFLTDIRLGAMRRHLTCPDPSTTVTSAAMDSGLFHVGRCSQAYRARYGELPSKTLHRARMSTLARNTAKH
jgi:AraC-like DNA-binding protein